MSRPYNFSAGPATLPEEVLRQAADEMLDWRGSGMSVMEMSHRSDEFISIYEGAQASFRALMAVPSNFKILFMQGGGLAENAIVPLNISHGGSADFVITGSWSEKSQKEAQKYCTVQIAASNKTNGHTALPDVASWRIRRDTRYVHICTNETIHGVEFHQLPDLKALGCNAPLVIDFSSHVASRTVDWSKVGLAFSGAQKNLGTAGLTLVVVRDDLIGHALPICPSAFDYKIVADHQSMYNTPPTYSIYIAGLVFKWLQQQSEAGATGIAAMEKRNIHKAKLLYEMIDGSSLYYSRVDENCRSRMNVSFWLRNETLNAAFLAGATSHGLLQLKGHKSVGGMRASIYNAMSVAGVEALIQYMREFEKKLA